MNTSTSRRRPVRRTRSTGLLLVLLVLAPLLGALAYFSWTASPSSAWSPIAAGPRPPLGTAGLGPADGLVPGGTTVFDDQVPAVARLDPKLRRALRQAGAEAADDGVVLLVNSGWRSRPYQEHLLDDAVATYGSRAEAARWVATPSTSPHVSGDAVDIGHSEASEWLADHGAVYGLCRVYDNEPWHFELRPEAAQDGCPVRYDDPTEDPRMRR